MNQSYGGYFKIIFNSTIWFTWYWHQLVVFSHLIEIVLVLGIRDDFQLNLGMFNSLVRSPYLDLVRWFWKPSRALLTQTLEQRAHHLSTLGQETSWTSQVFRAMIILLLSACVRQRIDCSSRHCWPCIYGQMRSKWLVQDGDWIRIQAFLVVQLQTDYSSHCRWWWVSLWSLCCASFFFSFDQRQWILSFLYLFLSMPVASSRFWAVGLSTSQSGIYER